VRVLGWELAGASPPRLAQVRRGIGYVFQQHGILDALSASENELPRFNALTTSRSDLRKSPACC
jgi:ABC-type lipoprotein export system ATPase subunit